MRYRLDDSWDRYDSSVLAGSPLRLFRATPAGVDVLDRLERGDEVAASHLVDRLLDAGAIHPMPDSTRPPQFGIDDVTVVTPRVRDAPSSAGGDVHDDGRITIDDGSAPPLAGASLRLAVNVGPAGARNAARPLIETPLVAFLDADVTAPDGARRWLQPLLWHFDDPQVGLVAPRVTGEQQSPLDLGASPARIRAGTRVSYVPGAALIVRVSALDAIGWFDDGLRFGEDVDLVWRLDQAGWRCRFDPAATVWHAPRSTWRARLRQHAGYGTSAAPLALRHPHALSPIRVNGWTAAAWALGLTGHVAAASSIAVGSAAALARTTSTGTSTTTTSARTASARTLPGIPRGAAFGLAMRGHLLAGRQLASAVRRVWWPIVGVGALFSRRCRWIALASIVADVRSTPTDIAYGWGVWRGMVRHRTAAPIVPRLSAWPERRPATRDRPTASPARRPDRSSGATPRGLDGAGR